MFARVMAWAMGLRFDSSRATGLDATLEVLLSVLGGRRVVPLRLRVRDGGCEITPGRDPHAGARVSIGFADMVRVALGRAAWPALLSTGRLELAGDPFLALRFPTLFRL